MDFVLLAVQEAHAWDFLRPLTDFAVSIDLPIKVLVLLLSLAFLAIALLAYFRTKSQRFLFITFAFCLFSVKWLFKTFDLFVSPGYFFSDPVENIFELLIFVSLFLALFKK